MTGLTDGARGRGRNGGDRSDWTEKESRAGPKVWISRKWWGRTAGDCGVGLLTLLGLGRAGLKKRRGRGEKVVEMS